VLVDFDECINDPCMNGGKCEDFLNGFSCRCVEGYSGAMCNIGNVLQVFETFMTIGIYVQPQWDDMGATV